MCLDPDSETEVRKSFSLTTFTTMTKQNNLKRDPLEKQHPKFENIRLAGSLAMMADATSLMPPSSGFSATLFPNKSAELYSPKEPQHKNNIRGYFLGPPHDTTTAGVISKSSAKWSFGNTASKVFSIHAMFILKSKFCKQNMTFVLKWKTIMYSIKVIIVKTSGLRSSLIKHK